MNDLPIDIDIGTRNFYEDLFSPDTSSSDSDSSSSENSLFQHETSNIQLSNLDILNIHDEKSNASLSDSDMDISSGESYSSENSSMSQLNISSSNSIPENDDMSLTSSHKKDGISIYDEAENIALPPVITYLEEEDIANLLGENVSLPEPERRETLEDKNVDIIASFNVRNKYEHSRAAELLLNEKLTFLALQEPYASSHKAAESWKAFQKLELESARISCFETPYQMILFDSWKWGGRIISPFQSLQYGRVAAIAFDLGNSLKVGIISVYASTVKSKCDDASEETTHPSMKISATLIQKILSKWKTLFPDMTTIILGDLQETLGTSDRDNLGAFRQDFTRDGIVAGLRDSHDSIVRKMNPNATYVTRFGEQGARGIDHIFFPKDKKHSDICIDAKIQREIGANYFPSDHSLLTCSILRGGQNNNCDGREKTKYNYNEIFSIKMSQNGELGQNINFDFSQFKSCDKFKKQLETFQKLQQLTGDDSILTNAYIHELEDRADALFQDLWRIGKLQRTDGSKNKLVEITDGQATELSFILNGFNHAIKTVMEEVKMVHERSNNDSAGKTRGRLRKRNGFKMFHNLPVPTKLRYVKNAVEAKANQIMKNIYWIKEFGIRNAHEDADKATMSQDLFWKQWDLILKSDNLKRKAVAATEAYMEEDSTRMLHISAIQHEGDKKGKKCKRESNKQDTKPTDGNILPHVSDNVTRLLNFWLSDSGCNQGFNAKSIKGNSPAFLSTKINDWKQHLDSASIDTTDLAIPHHSKLMLERLEKSHSELQKLVVQISKLQGFYRKSTLEYFLDSSNIASFTRKVAHKSRTAPAAHTSIWDSSTQEYRTCVNELEELRATSAFHGHWMANSRAQEICAFAKIRKQGRLGNRGIVLNPNRIVTLKDVPYLVHKGASLPRKIKKAFVRAHGPHTARLFREPVEDNPEFFYPFYLKNEKGVMQNGDELEKSLWKAISSTPSKARFEGFQLAVVGRFGARWRNLLLRIIKLILIMRYIPTALKKMARFPIPKPGKHNEYRPISLCHDLYCFIMGIITSYSSAAIERAGILHEGLTAYQKGKGCSNLVTTELSFREDCLENYVPSVQIDEDEEKFFDRIPVEILLAAMRVNGFPNQGYIEIKASAMEAKTVEIITAKGVTYARFICGLEQGNPDSPTISNLVIKFKHDVWSSISKEISEILKNNNIHHHESYKFNSVDLKDGQVFLCKIGYSDDNSKFISLSNEEDLLILVKYFTQLSGDISMVTKIGRKSSKCEIQFYNISADLAIRMEKVWSTAWSFLDDAPIQEQIPFKIHMKESELTKLYERLDFFNLDEEIQNQWNEIINAPAHKHLGLSSTLGADTSTAWRKNLEKMHEKVAVLKIQRMHLNAQRKCFNMLVGTIPTFVPIQTNFPSAELLKFDQHISKVCMKSNGLSKSDSKTRMFLPVKFGGLGFISTLELDLIAVAREFEIISNNWTLDSRTFRTRVSALTNYSIFSIYTSRNHAREAISKLAGYGIYIRDSSDGVINEILAEISTTYKSYKPLNHENYKDNCRLGIGLGKEKNKLLMLGGPIHSILHMLQDNNWESTDSINTIAESFNVSIKSLKRIYSKVRKINFLKSDRFFDYWEWKNSSLTKIEHIPKDKESWNFHHSNVKVGNEEVRNRCRVDWDQFVRLSKTTANIGFNTYSWEGKMLQFLVNSKSPILVATDGSHSTLEKESQEMPEIKTSSSFVFCVADIRDKESIKSGQWLNRPIIPIFGRASILPQNFGSTSTDIAHGEFGAILMAELAFADLPRVTLTDSKAIRQQVLHIRNLKEIVNDRHYIRSIAGGIGKYMSGLLRHLLHEKNSSSMRPPLSTKSPAMQILYNILLKRNETFIDLARSWISPTPRNKDDELVGWENQYFDDFISHPILKINSHQLDEAGIRIKDSPRYANLIPNLAVLNANHHADTCAELVKNFPHSSFGWNRPPGFLRFFLTCGGLNIDRNISSFCHDQFTILKIRKLRQKKTQGLLWRILHLTTTTWDIMLLYKGWLRSLLGLSSTHTRRTYKSEVYRECCKAEIIKNLQTDSQLEEICSAKPAEALKIYSHCLWCSNNRKSAHKGNRNHAFLFCSNPKISSFRTRLINLTEAKLKLFFLDLRKATNYDNVENGLKMIEGAFLDLQEKQTGRLKNLPIVLNNRYISIQNILAREKCNSIRAATESPNFNFMSEIFGLTPVLNGTEITDESLGLVDCPWLGLTPISIDKIMLNLCTNINAFIDHSRTAENLSIMLQQSWREIKNLIMGKAIGIHRVIGSTGKQFEKDWKKEFGIDINSIAKIKSEIRAHLSETQPPFKFSRTKRKFDSIVIHGKRNLKKAKGNVISPDSLPMKVCTGITCSRKYKMWFPNNTFSPNMIRISTRQCQRCSRSMTAVRQCNTLFTDIAKCPSPTAVLEFFSFIRMNHSYMKNRYHLFFEKLNACLPNESKIFLERNKRVIDRYKLISNISCITVQKSTNYFTIQDNEIPHRASKLLLNILSCKKLDFILDKEAEDKIQLLNNHNADICSRNLSTEFSSHTTQNTNINSVITEQTTAHGGLEILEKRNLIVSTNIRQNQNSQQPQIDKDQVITRTEAELTYLPPTTLPFLPSIIPGKKCKRITVKNVEKLSSKNRLEDFASRIIRPNVCLEGGNMMKAVEILRSFKTPSLFVASAESNSIISNWQLSNGWKQFARIFGSRDLLHNKVNATYLIPLFSGETSFGHWHLCIVQKLGSRDYKAWCLDSLGTGKVDEVIAQKIKNGFKPGRGRFTWISCTCKRQEELECGPRTILAMWTIQKKLLEGSSLEESIQSATLMGEPAHLFTPTKIREKIAIFVNNFKSGMITAPIRLRQRSPIHRAPLDNEASRNPINID